MKKSFILKDMKITPADDKSANVIIFIKPDDIEKKFLIDECLIDEHTLNSSLDPDELSRLEIEPGHVAIIFKRPKNYSGQDNLVFKVCSSGMFFYKDRLIMIMDEEIPIFSLKIFSKVTSITDAFLKILYSSVFHYLEHLRVINMISDEIEKKINTSFENKHLISLFAIEKSLVYYLNSINANKVLMEKIKLNAVKLNLGSDEIEFLDDIIIENDQCYKQAEIYSNILVGLGDARASIVNNNLNIHMKRLTIITIIFMPLNLISGIGGMSEFSMMTSRFPWPVSYLGFLMLLMMIAYFTYIVIKRMEKNKK